MSAAVARDGVIVWQRGFGQADISAHKPATADTVYHLASLTKPFAATVLLQLVQEGRLNLDSPVSDYGIDLKSQGTIRARHVLTHTSEGIPGETYRYNGTRFGELDKVLSGVTGRTFASEVSARILEPLALTNTSPNPLQPKSCEEARRDAADFRRRLAQGYRSEDLTPVEYKEHFVTAAGLVSTVGDMVRFSDALDDGLLLRPDTMRLAYTPPVAPGGKPLPYALGWFVQQHRGVQLVWHYGWWVGDSSLIIKIPERKLTFVLLANSEGLSRKFDLGRDNNVRRSPFARALLESAGL
jgi:CubicO group peptidase (beta-lactamase class C family)